MKGIQKYKGIVLLLIFYVFPFVTEAQKPVIIHFGINEGLPSTECYWTMQDSKGYLWVATDAGVVKYDGYKFITYNSSKGLQDNTVFKIREDRKGYIWFSGYSGKLSYYNHATDSIYAIPANTELDLMTDYFPVDFTFDDKNNLLVSLHKKGCFKISAPDYKTICSYFIQDTGFFIKKIGQKNLLYGLIYPDSTLYYHFHGSKISKVEYYPLLNLDANPPHHGGLKLAGLTFHLHAIPFNDTTALFSSEREIVAVSNIKQRFVIKEDFKYRPYGYIISMYKDHQNRLWVNRKDSGICVYDGLKTDRPIYRFLPGMSVTSVCEDSDHGYWITTLESGLYYIPSIKFCYLDQHSGLTNNKIFSIALTGENLYFLSADFKLGVLNISFNKITSSPWHVLAGSYLITDGNSLVVCQGWSYLLEKNRKLFFSEKIKGKLHTVWLKRGINYNNDFYLGYANGDVFFVDKHTGFISQTDKIIQGLPRIFSIHYNRNTIWIGTKNGLFGYKNKQLQFYGKQNTLFNARVEDMASVGDTVFLATRGYGILVMRDGKVLKQYTEADGLASNMTRCITVGKDHSVWVGTNNGISRLRMEAGGYAFTTLNVLNGLISNEVNQIIEYNKILYVATNEGLEIIDVDNFYNSSAKINVYIEELRINNSIHSPENTYNLNYNQNYISIAYKGLSVRSRGEIRYKYRLEGLDTNWVYTKNVYVQYTTLPPGGYRFVVYAINSDGKLSVMPATVTFVINKPFWETWWFILAIMSLVFLITYYMYKQRINSIRKKEKEKTEFNRKISNLELKALRAQMNPHFMFNAINSIQNFVLKNDSKSAQKYLTKFARLIRFVLENSKHELVLLQKEVEALELYIELEALRASFNFDYEISIDDSLHADNLYIPPMIIQPYVENAILHGIMPLTVRKGKLVIKFFKDENVLKCVIDDNGIGRKNAEEIKKRKRLSHESMGMTVTQDRINLFNNDNHNLLTEVTVIDKCDNHVALGTIVEISIHIKNSPND